MRFHELTGNKQNIQERNNGTIKSSSPDKEDWISSVALDGKRNPEVVGLRRSCLLSHISSLKYLDPSSKNSGSFSRETLVEMLDDD